MVVQEKNSGVRWSQDLTPSSADEPAFLGRFPGSSCLWPMRNETKKIIRQLGYTSYSKYLASDVWRARRLAYFAHNPKACWLCGRTTAIHLHHIDYDRIGGYELDGDLLPLCAPHHRGLHSFMRRKRVPLERAHTAYKRHLSTRKRR